MLFISPIIFEYGPIAVRWYGLMYAVSFSILLKVLHYESKKGFLPLNERQVDKLFSSLVILILFFARIFYVLFYDFGYYLQHPLEIIKLWNGGLSFHGGYFGVILATLYIQRITKVRWFVVMDTLALVGPIGFGLGRIGNFINGELFGRISTVPWAMVFEGGGALPRHPSQLYEAFFEGLVLSTLVWRLKTKVKFHGIISAAAFIGYSCSRFFIEFFREPDPQLGFILGPFTMGQLLTLPVLFFGCWLLRFAHQQAITVKKFN